MTKRSKLIFLDTGISAMNESGMQGRILVCNADGSDLQVLVDGIGTRPDGLALDLKNRHIYYTNMGGYDTTRDDGFISRVDLDGKNNVTIIPEGVTRTPKQITLEHTTKTLYWCDREGMRVFRSNMDGSHVEVLVVAGTGDEDRKDARNHCVGIAVDLHRHLMYWTQKGPPRGNQGRLFRAGLNIPHGDAAENRSDKAVLLDELPEPIDLDLDVEKNQLYLADRGDPPFGNTTNMIDLNDPKNVTKKILVRKLHESIGLTLDIKNRCMYMTDLQGAVYSANMDGSDEKVLLPDVGDLTGIAWYQE